MDDIAKLLIALGIGIALVGVIWLGVSRWLGGVQLPGTFVFETGNLTCIFPILVSIVLSVILTIVLNVVLRILNK